MKLTVGELSNPICNITASELCSYYCENANLGLQVLQS